MLDKFSFKHSQSGLSRQLPLHEQPTRNSMWLSPRIWRGMRRSEIHSNDVGNSASSTKFTTEVGGPLGPKGNTAVTAFSSVARRRTLSPSCSQYLATRPRASLRVSRESSSGFAISTPGAYGGLSVASIRTNSSLPS